MARLEESGYEEGDMHLSGSRVSFVLTRRGELHAKDQEGSIIRQSRRRKQRRKARGRVARRSPTSHPQLTELARLWCKSGHVRVRVSWLQILFLFERQVSRQKG
jgi:hypothetical protein